MLAAAAGMLASLRTAAVFGVEACAVQVEVDVSFGLPIFTMVGLPDASVRESRDRVKSAIRNSGFEFPPHRITVNLAPADVRKAGSSFDLPIALGILAAQGVVERREIADIVVLGELSLDGGIQPARGGAANRRGGPARRSDGSAPAGRERRRSGVVAGLEVLPVSSLAEAVGALNDPPAPASPRRRRCVSARAPTPTSPMSAASFWRAARWRSPLPAGTTSARRTAGCGQDDDGAASRRDPSAADVRRSAGGHGRSLRRRPAAPGAGLLTRASVPRAAPHDLERGAHRRRLAAASRAKSASPTTACCFSTRCSSSAGTCSRCCVSRSKKAR